MADDVLEQETEKLTFIDLYNEVTGQAWSMFDGDVEAYDEFEKSVTTSMQKALSALWCSYKFPFRNRELTLETKSGVSFYDTPNGNIVKKFVKGEKVFGVKIGKNFLSYEPDFETLEDKEGKPTHFYIKNDKLYLYPTPDDVYEVKVEYWTMFAACDSEGKSKATLVAEDDYIDIPEKYNEVFKNALITKCMVYAIASDADENHSGYQRQFDEAYKVLVDYVRGVEIDKTMGWGQV